MGGSIDIVRLRLVATEWFLFFRFVAFSSSGGGSSGGDVRGAGAAMTMLLSARFVVLLVVRLLLLESHHHPPAIHGTMAAYDIHSADLGRTKE